MVNVFPRERDVQVEKVLEKFREKEAQPTYPFLRNEYLPSPMDRKALRYEEVL